ncbi:MAG: glutamyl-tRNA reductase [Candidatus Helarchaeota archaeon]
MKNLYNFSATYKKFSVFELEQLYSENLEIVYRNILKLDGMEECVVLQTCNRIEYYIITHKIRAALDYFAHLWGPIIDLKKISFKTGDTALSHLIAITSGIDSLVIGETQILGQIKNSLKVAKTFHNCPKLSRIFKKALNTGIKIRKITKIDNNSFSIGSEAVKFAIQLVGTVSEKRILVIGAGKIGTLVAKSLKDAPFETIFIANRTYQRAQRLAQKFLFQAKEWSHIKDVLKAVDIVIVATSAPHSVLKYPDLQEIMPLRKTIPLQIIDISMPPNIDPRIGQLSNVKLYTLDALKKARKLYEQMNLNKIALVTKLIDEEVSNFKKEVSCLSVKPIITQLYKKLNTIREQELIRLFHQLPNLNPSQKKYIEAFSLALLKKFLFDINSNMLDLAKREGSVTLKLLSSVFIE